jgi:F420-non-reducing hydrogenase large subunit
MNRRITIDPVTRLEGHGKIEIILDDQGNVARTYWQVAELRGFERFCVGRPAEEMTRIMPNICGVCPSAHHLAAMKALDRVFGVEPTPTARLIRELEYNAFIVEDHYLHFFFLAAPDFIVGPDGDPAERNILGIVNRLGTDVVQRVLHIRRRNRDIIRRIFGKAPHPEGGLPGGVPSSLTEEDRRWMREVAAETVTFAQEALRLFKEKILACPEYRELILSDAYALPTNYLALVDDNDQVTFVEGTVKVVGPSGQELLRFPGEEYARHLAERVEPWTYVRMTYLRELGWDGVEGRSLYRVAPLARLNVASRMATPLAQAEREELFAFLGGRPAHQTLASHWARLICALQAAERNREIVEEPLLTGREIRNMAFRMTGRGVGCVEAPRGTLFHDYETDERGILTRVNLIVATQQNAGPISLSIDRAAREFIRGGEVREGLMNRVEMAMRAYDPCLSCATHVVNGVPAVVILIRDRAGTVLHHLQR